MHLNHYFFAQLTSELQTRLQGAWLAEAFTQEKDELVLGFAQKENDYYLKCQLGRALQAISLPLSFQRARRNSVDLFPKAIGKKVVQVFATPNDRSFGICLQNEVVLFFKMHGGKSNAVLYEQRRGIDQFHKSYPDLDVPLESYAKPSSFDMQALEDSDFDFKNHLPALGKEPLLWLHQQGFATASTDQKGELVCQMMEALHHPKQYYLLQGEGKVSLSFFETATVLEAVPTAIEAANGFLKHYYIYTIQHKQSETAQKALLDKKKRLESYLYHSNNRLADINGTLWEQTGDVLMANLHQLPTNVDNVTLFDFYQNAEREIKLKKDLSPQKNAEVYYRKAKNAAIEKVHLRKTIALKTEELAKVELELAKLAQSHNVPKKGIEVIKSKQLDVPLPYKQFLFEGYEIRVGKNSQKNDELTFQHASKNDLWLHARGFAGSHVILKVQAGKITPKHVIEKAAVLAAYYSKGKTDSLCPVIVTERKYVRKLKGAAPGKVVIDKEKVVMVRPESFGNAEELE